MSNSICPSFIDLNFFLFFFFYRKIGAPSRFVTGAQPEDNLVVVETRTDSEKGQAIATLIISPLRKSDDGLYTCIASNKVIFVVKNVLFLFYFIYYF